MILIINNEQYSVTGMQKSINQKSFKGAMFFVNTEKRTNPEIKITFWLSRYLINKIKLNECV